MEDMTDVWLTSRELEAIIHGICFAQMNSPSTNDEFLDRLVDKLSNVKKDLDSREDLLNLQDPESFCSQ